MSNPYINFINLLPKQVKKIVKVIRIENDGTVEVESVRGNSRMIIKGGSDNYALDEYVFMVDGIVTSKLSNIQPVIEYAVI